MVLLLFPLAALAAVDTVLLEQVDSGCIDWSTATVRASGAGAPADSDDNQSSDAAAGILDRARQSAQANLLRTVNTIRIDSITRIADRSADNEAFRDGLHALIDNAAITRQEYLSDGTLAIELTMSLTGGFGQFVLPEGIRQVEPVTTMTATQQEEPSPPGDEEAADTLPYTGMIIDATGIGARPALVPVIVDESGEVVYGPAFVSREFAVSRGMSGFATTLEAARKDQRVGSHPMIVKAVRTRPTGNTDLVISTADAARLRSSAAHLDFLKACRVSIVIDPMENS